MLPTLLFMARSSSTLLVSFNYNNELDLSSSPEISQVSQLVNTVSCRLAYSSSQLMIKK